MSYTPGTTELQCDGAVYRDGQWQEGESCPRDVTHVDNKGWLYCTPHGESRRSQRPCRKLRPHELNRLARGEQIKRYW